MLFTGTWDCPVSPEMVFESRRDPVCKLTIVDPLSDPRWDHFVSGHADAKVYHLSAWSRMVSRTYGYQPCGVLAEGGDNQNVKGVLPLSYIKSPLGGGRLVSLPFTTYCDPLMPAHLLRPTLEFIRERFATANSLQLRLAGCNFRDFTPTAPPEAFVTHILDLRPGLDVVFGSFHATSVRQRIKRAERVGLTLRIGENEKDVRAFYKLLLRVRKRHGLPAPPYGFFRNMWKCLQPAGLMKLLVVKHGHAAVAAAVLLLFGDTANLEYSASDERTMRLSSNQKLIWECIRIACEKGTNYFDFGRSAIADRPLIDFKERWGAKPKPLRYVTFPSAAARHSQTGLSYPILTSLNRRMPTWVLRLQGELLYRVLRRS